MVISSMRAALSYSSGMISRVVPALSRDPSPLAIVMKIERINVVR
jgi:hypothetical protein